VEADDEELPTEVDERERREEDDDESKREVARGGAHTTLARRGSYTGCWEFLRLAAPLSPDEIIPIYPRGSLRKRN
jgi:hypothetical protein